MPQSISIGKPLSAALLLLVLTVLDSGSKFEVPISSKVLLIVIDVQSLNLEHSTGVGLGPSGSSLFHFFSEDF